MKQLPLPVRVAAGLAVTAVDRARHLPEKLAELPVTVVSQALQLSMRVQQQMTELAIKGASPESYVVANHRLAVSRQRAPVHGHELAKHVPRADDQPRGLAVVLQVLRFLAEQLVPHTATNKIGLVTGGL